jgi:hypothetical protein
VLSSAQRRRSRPARGETTMPDRSPHATLPAETAYCHTCGFEHTRRPDWHCPRCGMPAGTEPPPRRAAAASAEKPTFPMGSTIAGAVMAVNAVVLLIGFGRHPASEYRWAVLGTASVLGMLALELLLTMTPEGIGAAHRLAPMASTRPRSPCSAVRWV